MTDFLFSKLVQIFWVLGPAAIVLGILIFIHELGHFIAARLVGIRVEIFSIGFGRRLIGFKKGGTDYRLSLIPFGGYVRMAGEELPGQSEPDAAEDDTAASDSSTRPAAVSRGDTLQEKSVPQRMLVAVAGALMNAVLAVVLTIGLAYFGIYVESYLLQPPVIAHVQSGSPADTAGIQPRDTIIGVDGKNVETWEDAQLELILNAFTSFDMTIRRDGQAVTVSIPADDEQKYPFAGIAYPSRIMIGKLTKGSPAEKADLAENDQIIAIDGAPLFSIYQLIDAINDSQGDSVSLTVLRNGSEKTVTLKPEYNEDTGRYMIGIAFGEDPDKVLRKYPAGQAFQKAVDLNIQMGKAMFGLVAKLVMGRESMDQLGGPVMIVDMAGKAARAGLRDLIWLTALISLNLAILNLLPIPVLDGGMIVFLLFEAIFRKPVSEKIQVALQNVFFFLLIGFALYVTYNDIIRIAFQ
jgi:regulator of sigma E protease